MNTDIIKQMSSDLGITVKQVEVTLKLLEEGNTIPFIARYRKEATGALDEEKIKAIEEVYSYQVNLLKRKEDVIRLIDEKEMLTDELKAEIMKCVKLVEVEDLYRPYKEKKKTKATEAIALGLEPLAKIIMSFPINIDIEKTASEYITDKVVSIEDAIQGAKYIIAEWISDNASYRKYIRNNIFNFGTIVSKLKKKAVDDEQIYKMYYDYSEKIKFAKPHRILAINRGEKEGILSVNIDINTEHIMSFLEKKNIKKQESPCATIVKEAIEDSYKRLIFPSIEREIKASLKEDAEEGAIGVFGKNLEKLLLTPPMKDKVVLGFDPAFRTGCKLAVISSTGEMEHIDVIYPHEPKNQVAEAEKIMLDLIKKYDVKIIAIGNGTASRESETFVSNLIKNNNLDVKFVIVSEAGASVYSASPLAKKEFPDYSVEQRSAVSIGRRLQDSLSELVKIDPKSIGVGLYQHDLKQKELDEELGFVVSKIVNKIGVNLNNASESILNYVSGLNKKVIKKILDYKKKYGSFKNREELKKTGMDDFTFLQCAGFLRVFGEFPLDKTNIHPEDYELVTKILSDYDLDINTVGTLVMQNKLDSVNSEEVIKKYDISREKWELIKTNLVNGVIDPRDDVKQMVLRSDVLSIDDLELGMSLEGAVRNVTSFGAFVDIGLHDDGLVHISKMSKGFVKHPSEILKVGDIINVFICGIDKDKGRVNLSLIEE